MLHTEGNALAGAGARMLPWQRSACGVWGGDGMCIADVSGGMGTPLPPPEVGSDLAPG